MGPNEGPLGPMGTYLDLWGWGLLGTHGDLWGLSGRMETCWDLWRPMGTYEYPWRPMVTHGAHGDLGGPIQPMGPYVEV